MMHRHPPNNTTCFEESPQSSINELTYQYTTTPEEEGEEDNHRHNYRRYRDNQREMLTDQERKRFQNIDRRISRIKAKTDVQKRAITEVRTIVNGNLRLIQLLFTIALTLTNAIEQIQAAPIKPPTQHDSDSIVNGVLVTHYDCTEPSDTKVYALTEVPQCEFKPADTQKVVAEVQLYQRSIL